MCYDVVCCDMIAKIREVADEAAQDFLYKKTKRYMDIYCVISHSRLSRVFPGSECLEVAGLKDQQSKTATDDHDDKSLYQT